MYRFLLPVLFFTISISAFSQAPQLINYQAIIRSVSGEVLSNQRVGIRLSLISKDSKVEVYSEEHQVTTNSIGVVSLKFGEGNNSTSRFNEIKWEEGPYSVELSLDKNGGTSYTLMGSTDLVSVPYALYAGNVSYSDTSSSNELQSLNFANDSLILSQGNHIRLPVGSNTQRITLVEGDIIGLRQDIDNEVDQLLQKMGRDSLTIMLALDLHILLDEDLDSTNEYQTITISGDTLSLSDNGGRVVLPSDNDGDSTNEIQSLMLKGDTLFLSASNNILLNKFNEDSTRIADTDGNTRIETERSANEDKIRVTMGGVEYFVLDSGRIDINNTGSSVFIGTDAGLNDDRSFNDNTFVGNRSGRSNRTGNKNTALGRNSLLSNTSGGSNVALGNGSLEFNLTGFYNVAIGRTSLYSNQSTYSNVAIGHEALHDLTGNGGNIGIGHRSLRYNSVGSKNTAIGFETMDTNLTGSENVAIGGEVMKANTTGSQNVAIGFRSGHWSLGSRNIFIGYYARSDSNQAFDNSIALGYYTRNTASNQVRIGNSSTASIGGQVGWSTLSDARVKNSITEDVVGLDFIMKLRPVTYYYKEVESHLPEGASSDRIEIVKHSGFLAQEVESAALASGFDFSGIDKPKNEKDLYSLRYAEFVVPLVKGMQEQQELILKQQQMIEELAKRIDELESK